MITTNDILKVASYFKTINHTKGRLRVKIDKAILDDVKNVSLEDITNLPQQIDGLQEIKVNKIMATATILYDASVLNPQFWDELIAGENLDEITNILNKLQSKIKEN